MGKYFTKAEIRAGEGDFFYRKKEWAEKSAVAARKRGLKATVSGSRGSWEVRVRQK